jgi:heme oxygenase
MHVETTSIMQRLRDETRDCHEHAESREFEQAMFRGTLPRGLYVQMLGQRYLIHRALEREMRRLAEHYPHVAMVVREQLFQEPNLRDDLSFFEVDAESCRPCSGTRRLVGLIESLAREQPLSLLGVYYVFEGSKNGGRMITRSVRGAYGLPPDQGTRYLDPHGNEQRSLWQQFKDQMDAAPLAPTDRDAMVAAARQTFECVSAIDDELFASRAGDAAWSGPS